MSPKRGDRVAPPAAPSGWELRFASSDAAKGWEDLCQQAAANTLAAWTELRNRDTFAVQSPRHHRLKGPLASASHGGLDLPQWQIEITGPSLSASGRA
ncbi:hypothetical protein [Nocardia camponoti]|uniref:Uncharacterized protein n=1 Tax=Nocardia camponoti TaxID=1616106 RepID=A0A917QTE7_9NOCA|nr:hypothetical protein [Nocardia camponoti]GGK67656.1 hypothetical protein GCM10011591_44760 [Nocardia camponoti]